MLSDGHLLAHRHLGEDCGWAGPPGWLDRFGAGDLVALRLAGGRLAVSAVLDEPALPEGLADRLHRVFPRLNEDDGFPVFVDELLLAAIAEDPEAFRTALPPVPELLAGAGFELRDRWTAPAGTEWDAHDEMRETVHLLSHELAAAGVMAVRAALAACRQVGGGSTDAGSGTGPGPDPQPTPDPGLAELAAGLAENDRALEAFWDEAVGPGYDHRPVQDLAERLLTVAAGRPRAVPLWLLARCAQAEGRTLDAERLILEAHDADPRLDPVVEDTAWYATDRGDARRAVSLLHRVRTGDDGELALLRRMAERPRAGRGRNEPCPCGSGRKYKHCHLGREEVPLADRMQWLLEKGRTYLHRAAAADAILAVAAALTGEDDPSVAKIRGVVESPLVADLALFEEGWWDRFVSDRGILLPDDERELAARWIGARSSVHRVVEVRPGDGLTMTDTADGRRVVVRERTYSSQARVDDLVWCRVLPDGAGHQLSGALVSLTLRHRDPLLAFLAGCPSGLELATFFGDLRRPPRLTNTEGEDLVLCEARYEVPDLDRVRAGLDARLEAEDGDAWHQWHEKDGQRWIRATVHVEDTFLVVQANSVARFERITELVAAAAPKATLVNEERTPASVALATHRAGRADEGGATAAMPAMQDSPELRETMARYMEDQERRWVDVPLPVLGGLSPRQAAADPERCEDLRLLLHEMDRHDETEPAGGFSVTRLHALLDLP